MTDTLAALMELFPPVNLDEAKSLALHVLEYDVKGEVYKQDEKWGPQSHPLVGGEYPDLLINTYRECAEEWKARNDSRVRAGALGWDGILLEEVFEALECDNVEAACGELVQVMAVCAQMILDLRSRRTVQVSQPGEMPEDGVL